MFFKLNQRNYNSIVRLKHIKIYVYVAEKLEKFKLYDNINNYLSLNIKNPDDPFDAITFLMHLIYTSPIQNNWDVMTYTH